MIETRIQIRGRAAGRAIQTRVARRLSGVLASLPVGATGVRVAFTDENGPKGGDAIRCSVEVRLPRRPPMRVEDVASAPRLALDAALTKLERRLRRVRERTRESKRRPKKYYTARRTLAAS
jgi:ribosome-associated translation inhibitor RaiA